MQKEFFNPITGFKDVIDRKFIYQELYSITLFFAKSHGYFEAILPILEKSSLFERNLGEESDINLKELYKFSFYNENLALRPEFTAGISRMICSMEGFCKNHQDKNELNLFSFGPVFRHDRPQAGRYRQFYQANFESFKNSSEICDISNILLASRIVDTLYAKQNDNTNKCKYVIEINSLGSQETKVKYQEVLKQYFEKYKNDLSEDSKKRLIKNPIRILDTKDINDKKLLENVPQIKSIFTKEEETRINNICNVLSRTLSNIFELNLAQDLVRGLDYYTSTVFEIKQVKHNQNSLTLIAGGRYDNLINQISDKHYNISAFGFSCGVERLIENFYADKFFEASKNNIQNNDEVGKIKQSINFLNTKLNINDKTNTATQDSNILNSMLSQSIIDTRVAIVLLSKTNFDLNIAKYGLQVQKMLTLYGFYTSIFNSNKSISKTINDLSDDNFDIVVFVGEKEYQKNSFNFKIINKNVSEDQKNELHLLYREIEKKIINSNK